MKDRSRQIVRKISKDLPQRFDPAGGCSDYDYVLFHHQQLRKIHATGHNSLQGLRLCIAHDALSGSVETILLQESRAVSDELGQQSWPFKLRGFNFEVQRSPTSISRMGASSAPQANK